MICVIVLIFLAKILLLFFGMMDVVKFKYETAPHSFLAIMKTTLQQKINTLIHNSKFTLTVQYMSTVISK